MSPAWPYSSFEVGAILTATEVAFFTALFVNVITLFDFHTGIDDRNEMDLFFFHILYKSLEIRETFFIYGEVLVILHVVNIHVNHIERHIHIIRSLMTEMPVTLPSVKVETESRVILQLPPDVQAALERKALDSKMTLTDFLATKINEIVREGTPASPSLVDEIEREEFSKDKD